MPTEELRIEWCRKGHSKSTCPIDPDWLECVISTGNKGHFVHYSALRVYMGDQLTCSFNLSLSSTQGLHKYSEHMEILNSLRAGTGA